MGLSEEALNRIKARTHPVLESIQRAEELMRLVPKASAFFAICGTNIGFDSMELRDGFLSIRKVTNPPGVVRVARAANLERSDYLGVSRYSLGVRAEIVVGDEESEEDEEFLSNIAWHTAALLKLRGHATLFCPASSTASWDTLGAVSDNSVNFRMLDDVPRQIRLSTAAIPISPEDVKWVDSNFDAAMELRDAENSRRFGLAFNMMYVWNHTSDLRIAMANIWVGLEALFGNRNDRPATEALAQRISDWLPTVSKDRVKALYNQRCNCVHGRWLNEREVYRDLEESEQLLWEALIKCIETNTKTLPDWR
jgi:hypothetical protein